MNENDIARTELEKIWAKRAQQLAELPPEETHGETFDLLIFQLGTEQYAIEVGHVEEIYTFDHLTLVPQTPNFIAGIFSARGRLLTVLDLAAFLGLSAKLYEAQARIISVRYDDHTSLGILATTVSEVRTLYREQIDPTVVTHQRSTPYTFGVTSDLIEVLDLSRLLQDKQLIVKVDL